MRKLIERRTRMVHLTGPAVVLIAVVGYLGINSIVRFIDNLFDKDESKRSEDKRK